MSAKIISLLCGAMGLLAGCDAAATDPLTQNELTTSEYRTPNANGTFNISFQQFVAPQTYRASAGSASGYSFQAGAADQKGLFAVSGILPGSDVTRPPSTGTASYAGTYHLVRIDDIGFVTNQQTGVRSILGQPTLVDGKVTLLADFDDGSVADNGTGGLRVNGQVIGRSLEGTVEYNGVGGQLDGLIGDNRAIGVFNGEGNVGPGTDDDFMYAGGFIANRN